MIEWLSGWLKEIILVILLATFIDLILPNTVMQRYVKVVVGLFILMTILSPIISLLKEDLDLNKAAMEIEQWTDGPQAETAALRQDRQSDSVETILKNGERLQEAEQQQSNRLVEKRIEEMVTESMDSSFPNRLQSVKVETQLDKKGKPQIEHMRVVLHKTVHFHSDAGTNTDEDIAPMKPIEPVRPVSVQIDPIDASDGQMTSKAEQSAQLEQLRDEVKQQLMREWQIDSDRLNVVYEDE